MGCNEPVVNDSLTCATPEHQKVEALHHDKGQSRFQLRNRLERARQTYSSSRSENTRALSQLTDLDNDIESFAIHNNGRITSGDHAESEDASEDDPPPPSATKKLRAKFTRSRTHNEQLAVAPCGIIFSRDTMFGAEGVASVAVGINFISPKLACSSHIFLPQGISQTDVSYRGP